MAAYGALASLMQILTATTLQPLDDWFFNFRNNRQVSFLTEKVSFLLDFLENSSTKTSNEIIASLEKKIRDAASAAEDMIVEPQLNEVLLSQLLSASRKEKYVLLHMICMVIGNLIPVIKRVKSLVVKDLMSEAKVRSIYLISSVLRYLVFGAAVVLLDSIFPVIELLMCVYDFLMSGGSGFLVYVIFWVVDHLLFEAATTLLENVIYKIVWPALIGILLPVNFRNMISAIVHNSIYSPLRRNFVWVYHGTILRLVIRVFESIIEEVTEITGEASTERNELPAVVSRHDDSGGIGNRNAVVGLESDLLKMKDQLAAGSSSKLEIVSIVGMGGIGKTTLARQVHDDPYIVEHFYIRAWVAVSQEYSLRKVLLGLLDSAKLLTQEMQEVSDDRLAEYLYRNLKGRRYLIVMDDVWDTEIWDSLRRLFPDDYNGSRVLLTTRLSDVALYTNSGSPLHQMRFLSADESWNLLGQKVFGDIDCPSELEEIGKEIARNCKGLPLAIVVIGGLLLKNSATRENWRNIAENLNSVVNEDDEQCLEILGLSYNHLPHHLKPCFLYMGVFPEDCEIPVSKLISLWAAEGFLKPSRSLSLEEVAEEHLKDLIQRSLILVSKHSCNGKVKTCYVHDLLRQVCLLNLQKENFFRVVNSDRYLTMEEAELHRRLSLHPNTLYCKTSCDLLSSYSLVRSFLCIGKHLITSPSDVCLRFILLRVLDIVVVKFHEFPDEIVELVHLRYLGFSYNGPLPPSIAELRNLQTIVHQNWRFGRYYSLPMEIWSMPNLRHLYIRPSCLPGPLDDRALGRIYPLENLKSLLEVRDFRCTRSILRRIPNVKNLGISYDVSPSIDWSVYELESLVDLCQLETLKIVMRNPHFVYPPKLAFPQTLKELTLSGCGIPWENMTIIGALPNLQVLKLRRNACCGLEWETVEGEFRQLMFLLLEEMDLMVWRSDETHFPRLQHLVIRSCYRLKEIPSDIGVIPTLQMIELVDCLPSAVESTKEMQEYLESMGIEDLKIHTDLRRHFKDRFNSRILR